MELPSEGGAVAAVNDGKAATDHPGVPEPSTIVTIDATGADASKNKYPAILDGTFFRVVSVVDDGNSVKTACVTCPAGNNPAGGQSQLLLIFYFTSRYVRFCLIYVTVLA